MKIGGLQKLTLLDFPNKTACTVFTPGCNFRCPFCHNASLVLSGEGTMSEDDIFSFLKKRRGLLDGVCITGGEPLLQKDIGDFLTRVKELGYLVKLDTNGSFPDKLSELVRAGLVDYCAVDIKNSPEKYPLTAGADSGILPKVEQSVEFLLSGGVDYEFRTTVVDPFHEEEDFYAIGEWIRGAKRYFLQNFTDSGDTLEKGLKAYPKERLEAFCKAVSPFVEEVQIRGI